MNPLEKYALLAEIIGGIAIVVSLIFVGLQVRHSNTLASTDALRDGTELWTSAYVTAFGTEESTAFFAKATNRCEELSPQERGRFFAVLSRLLSAYDNIYNQYESGRLREEVFVSIASIYYGIARMPCVADVLNHDFVLLPSWLVSSSDIQALSGKEDKMKPMRFLLE